ncbi:MAG: radical SAM protein [Proteobacteria bacterium]|nr:radical SAM protein [Pseudomonadota bacterium]
MQVLLIAVNQEKHPYPVQPIGATYIAAALREKGHHVKLLDLNFVDDFRKEIPLVLNGFKPGLVGISIRNIDNTMYPNMEFYLPRIKEIVNCCKAYTPARLVVGGSGFSVMPQEILEYFDLDLGITGNGEEVICAVVSRMEEGTDIERIDGIVYKKNGAYIKNPVTYTSYGCDGLEPDRFLLDLERYFEEGSVAPIQSKRGCEFDCIYCTYPLIEGKMVRVRDPKMVVDEIEKLKRDYGIDYVFFIDNVFNYPMNHAIAICQEIIDRKIEIQWTGFFNPTFMTEESVSLLKESGCSGVELGTEAACDKMLKNLGKSFNLNTLISSHKLCAEAGLKTCHYLLLGGPGETIETAEETLQVMRELNPTAVIVATGIRIYPGTPIEKIALEDGYNLQNLLIPQFYISKELGENVEETIQNFAKKYPEFIFEGVHKKTSKEILKMMRRMGFKGPSWEFAPVMNRLLKRQGQDGQKT